MRHRNRNGLGQLNGTAGAISVNPWIANGIRAFAGFLQMAMGAAFTIIVGIFQTGVIDQMVMATMILLATVASGLFYALARSAQTSGR